MEILLEMDSYSKKNHCFCLFSPPSLPFPMEPIIKECKLIHVVQVVWATSKQEKEIEQYIEEEEKDIKFVCAWK